MNLFSQVMATVKSAFKAAPRNFNAMDHCLAVAGVDPTEVRPGPSGIPASVLAGCRKGLVIVPGTDQVARRKDGTVIMSKDKRGRVYPVMDQYGIDTTRWKSMQNDEKRKAQKRWYSGEPADVRAARLNAKAA